MSLIVNKLQSFFKDKKSVAITVGALLTLVGIKLYFRGGVCRADRDLTGKVIVVTGGSAGIGRATIEALASKECTIIFGARDNAKSEQLVKSMLSKHKKCKVLYFPLDLSDKRSINQFSEKVKQTTEIVDVLINNAGLTTNERKTTQDGFQMVMGVNHLGHFYLTFLLWNKIKAAHKPRIINVSSNAHRGFGFPKRQIGIDFQDFNLVNNFSWQTAYARSKIANILFTRMLQRKMDQIGFQGYTYSLHPGVVSTQIARAFGLKAQILQFILTPILYLFAKTPAEGAQTTLYTVLQNQLRLENGGYYRDCKVQSPTTYCQSERNAERLWDISEKQLGIKFNV